ncbi:MAG TPA: AAA family ATPase [Candidatus Angelobacter sp.]|jgi:RecA/RadA recombinase|nr:AAA family ATPase [Candidatus Angelobacter sp.]
MPDGLIKPRSRLKAIQPASVEPSKPVILIYGRPNAGKTWTSLEFPKCYYIDTEAGANQKHYIDKLVNSGGAYLGPKQGSNDFSVVLEQIQALAAEPHPYKTLVIDSVSHLFGTEVSYEQERLDNAHERDEYGASNKPATRKLRRILNWLEKIDMNVVLIAHERDEYGFVNGKREAIGKTFDCWIKLEYILNLALHITKPTPGPERLARIKKTRLKGFPENETFPWSYEEFANRYGRAIMESDAKVFDAATEEQLTEFSKLYERIKMPDGWLDSCLKKGKSEQIEDMHTEHVAAMIKQMQERIVS